MTMEPDEIIAREEERLMKALGKTGARIEIRKHEGVKCTLCEKSLGDRGIKLANGKFCHLECLSCSKCKKYVN
jgi:hypothetical protein